MRDESAEGGRRAHNPTAQEAGDYFEGMLAGLYDIAVEDQATARPQR